MAALSVPVKKALKEALRDAYDGPLVDFEVVCDRVNAEVFDTVFSDPEINGMVKLDGKDSFSIYLNKRHHHNRKRFTLAHELGHIISYIAGSLSKEPLENDGFVERRTLDKLDDIEREANEIAAEILMPEEILEGLVSKLKKPSVDKLAAHFEVSVSAMSVRLSKLGYNLNDFSTCD